MRRVVLLTVIATLVVWVSAAQPVVVIGSAATFDVAHVVVPPDAVPVAVVDDDVSPQHAPWSPPVRCTVVATQFVADTDPVVGVVDDVGSIAVDGCALATVLSRGPPAR